MTTTRPLRACSGSAPTVCGTAAALGPSGRVHRLAAALMIPFVMAACVALPSARMALPTDLASATPLPFDGIGGGRSGRFTLEGQEVTFRRTGDALSVFDRLRLDRVSVEFERAGSKGRCDGRAATVTAGGVDAAAQPLLLDCRFAGAVPGELRLKEPRLAGAGIRQAREGQAIFASLVIDIRSEHALAGSRSPLAQPAGYRLMIQGRDVAALELVGGTPVLHRRSGLDEATRAAVTQTALALGLLFEPAVTLG
jgi:hypothetical protein